MKKLFFIAIVMAGIFLTSCSSQHNEIQHEKMFLNKVDKPYYEQTGETTTTEAVHVVIQKGMTVWDIAKTGTGMPKEEWKVIFDLNFDLLKDRLEYKIKNGHQVPWIWIYPKDVLDLPSYYAGTSPDFLTVQTVIHETEYIKTKKILYTIDDEKRSGGITLSKKQLDSLGVTNSKTIIMKPKHPVVEPILDRKESHSSFGWLLTVIKWILAILLLLFVIGLAIILLFGGFQRFMEFFDNNHQNNNHDDINNGGEDGDGNGGNDGDGNGNGENQQPQPVVDVIALTGQLQETGGKVTVGDIEIDIPIQQTPAAEAGEN